MCMYRVCSHVYSYCSLCRAVLISGGALKYWLVLQLLVRWSILHHTLALENPKLCSSTEGQSCSCSAQNNAWACADLCTAMPWHDVTRPKKCAAPIRWFIFPFYSRNRLSSVTLLPASALLLFRASTSSLTSLEIQNTEYLESWKAPVSHPASVSVCAASLISLSTSTQSFPELSAPSSAKPATSFLRPPTAQWDSGNQV